MPNCRNCGARLSKFDSDICPVCGIKDPLKGISSETVEITSQIDLGEMKEEQKIVRRRKTMTLLFYALGWTGAAFFYIKKAVVGLVWLLANLLVMGGVFAIFYFAIKANIVIDIIVPILIVYFVNAVFATIYYFAPNLKDGDGEFIV